MIVLKLPMRVKDRARKNAKIKADQCRHYWHVKNPDAGWLTERGDEPEHIWYRGFLGEAIFGEAYGVPMPPFNPNGGDGGIDFTINDQTIDVKTNTYNGPNPDLYLMVKEDTIVKKKNAEIYILSKYLRETDDIAWVGWAYIGHVLTKTPQKKPTDQLNRILKDGELLPMDHFFLLNFMLEFDNDRYDNEMALLHNKDDGL